MGTQPQDENARKIDEKYEYDLEAEAAEEGMPLPPEKDQDEITREIGN